MCLLQQKAHLCIVHADDDLPLDAAADIISACCGLLASSGKVQHLDYASLGLYK